MDRSIRIYELTYDLKELASQMMMKTLGKIDQTTITPSHSHVTCATEDCERTGIFIRLGYFFQTNMAGDLSKLGAAEKMLFISFKCLELL